MCSDVIKVHLKGFIVIYNSKQNLERKNQNKVTIHWGGWGVMEGLAKYHMFTSLFLVSLNYFNIPTTLTDLASGRDKSEGQPKDLP